MSVAKKAKQGNSRSFQKAWTESFGVTKCNGKALGLYILCTESVGDLLLCISFKIEDVNSYVVFSNPKPLSWPIRVELPCWHFGIRS